MADNNYPELFKKEVISSVNTDNQINFDYVAAYERRGYDISEYTLVQLTDYIGAINEEGKLAFAIKDGMLGRRLKEHRYLKADVKKVVHHFPNAFFYLDVKEIPSSIEIENNGLVSGFVFGNDETFDIIAKMGDMAAYGAKYSLRPYLDDRVKAVSVDDANVSLIFRSIALSNYVKENTLVYGTVNNINVGFPVVIEFQLDSFAKREPDEVKKYEPHFEINYSPEPNRSFGRIIKGGDFSSRIVGMKFREEFDFIKNSLNQGDRVQISLDPDNQYDEDALKVTKDGLLIGYIAKKHKPAVLVFMKRKQIEAEIEFLNFDEDYIDIRIRPKQKDFLKKYIKKYGIHFMKIEKIKRGYEYAENMFLITEDEFKNTLPVL